MDKDRALVSVCVLAYQHGAYIADALDSVLEQQGPFELEIVLGEDDSSDGTREICERYAAQYPDTIRLLLHERSQNIRIRGRPTGRFNFSRVYAEAQGEFICFLDGDDRMIPADRLAKQLEHLKAHPVHVAIGGGVINLEGDQWWTWALDQPAVVGREDILRGHRMPFGSIMYRRKALFDDLPPWFLYEAPVGDVFLHARASRQGPIAFQTEAWLEHRVHPGAVWSSLGYARQRVELAVVYELLLEHEAQDDDERALLGVRHRYYARRRQVVEWAESGPLPLRVLCRGLLDARGVAARLSNALRNRSGRSSES